MTRWLWLTLAACTADPTLDERVQQPPPGLDLRVQDLVPGGQVQFEIRGAPPGALVYVGGSTRGTGQGPCPSQLGGRCLDIRNPVLLASASADGAGIARLTVSAPASLPTVWLQAATAGSASEVSNVVSNDVIPVSALGPGDLVLTEIMKDPDAVLDAYGEWIEILNPGTRAVDLMGLELADLGADRFTVSRSLVLPAGGLVVLGASTDPSINGGAPVDEAWSGFALGNGDDEVLLRVGNVVLDEVIYSGGWPDPRGASLSLDPTATNAVANDTSTSWCAATRSYGDGDEGSPGAPNPSCGTLPPCPSGLDLDADGWQDCEDCDDRDARTFPGAPEACDGIDNDCSGTVPPAELDLDGDGMPDCDACDAAGYRSVAGTLTGNALEDALRTVASAQDCNDYPTERAYMFVQLHKDASGLVEGVYTGVQTAVGLTEPNPFVMNTEHVWPQSQGTSAEPARCDLNHLFPADADANGQRASLPFGVVTQAVEWSQGGSIRGRDAGGTLVFEPRDSRKGDIARAMLYMHMRHQLPLSGSQAARMQAWHLADPVDGDELRRAWMIDARQGAGNPYVFCPDLVPDL